MNVEKRFLQKVEREEDCWEWTSAKNEKGYGLFFLNGKTRRATHIMWELYYGKKPPRNMCVCHICDNPSCVNPAHLFLGTTADNNHDSMKKGRWRFPSKVLTPSEVTRIRNLYKFGSKKQGTYGLADRFGVDQKTIHSIVRGRTWRDQP